MGEMVSLVRELCKRLDSSEVAMLCAMSHSQVTVSGHLVKPQHDRAWTEDQLAGRIAKVNGRRAVLFPENRHGAIRVAA